MASCIVIILVVCIIRLSDNITHLRFVQVHAGLGLLANQHQDTLLYGLRYRARQLIVPFACPHSVGLTPHHQPAECVAWTNAQVAQ